MTDATTQPTLPELCRAAIDLITTALTKQPGELKEEVDDAERTIVQLRDRLIDLRRQRGDEVPHDALNAANIALSLVVGVEYPVGGAQRKSLEHARATLQQLLDTKQLP